MKALCFILFVHVLLLSVKPCCPGDVCSDKPTAQATQPVLSEDDCAVCSPFYCCSSCVAFVVITAVTKHDTAVTYVDGQYWAIGTAPVKNLSIAIWQPPQLS